MFKDLQEKLQETFSYHEDGFLIWNKSKRGIKSKASAGWLPSGSYGQIHFDGKLHGAHRLIYCYHHGEMPELVDHIDNDPANNKIENLRAATRSGNAANSKIRTDNKSGIKGVCWDKRESKWRVYINVDKKRKELGAYEQIELAELVISEAREKYHGEFSRHA